LGTSTTEQQLTRLPNTFGLVDRNELEYEIERRIEQLHEDELHEYDNED
jgi:hypothetical protein